MTTKPAYLILADGTVYEGKGFGAEVECTGEVVFSTSMSGYQEALTDPGSIGTILCQTFPSAGNYGTNSLDNESARVWAAGFVVREWCEQPSNFRCEQTLDAYLKDHGVSGLCGIDTRALTRHLRRNGVQNGAILPTLPEDMDAFLQKLREANPLENAVRRVSRTEVTGFPAEVEKKYKVVLYDFGVKESVIRQLALRGCEVVAVPCDYPADKLGALSPSGIVLSNGPGGAAELADIIENTKAVAKLGLPIFGIDLGHQVLAVAMGGQTEKLPFGHHGENQPVTDLVRNRTYITSQSHSYTVAADGPHNSQVSHRNANDGSVEGLRYPNLPAFSVQFHPEAAAGPEDTAFLFDDFIHMMKGG